jgi:Flp pilus assembly protein TadG
MLPMRTHIPRFPARHSGTRRRRLKNERGAALVEYAFILIVLLTTLFGIGAFGQALYAYHFVNNVAKEAARWASVNGSTCASDNSCNGVGYMNNGPAKSGDVTNYVLNHTPAGINSAGITVTSCGVAAGTACPVTNTPAICTTAQGTGAGLIPATPNYPGCTVQVQVQYTFTMIFPLIRTAPMTISSTSDMIIVH